MFSLSSISIASSSQPLHEVHQFQNRHVVSTQRKTLKMQFNFCSLFAATGFAQTN